MKEPKVKAKQPIVFVTGIGQTWSTLRGEPQERWNLFPGSKEVLLRGFTAADYLRAAGLGARALISAVSGRRLLRARDINRVLSPLFKYCIADENGRLSDEVDVRIYGARSFDKLADIDFATGQEKPGCPDSLLTRLYKDIPCRELAKLYGAENMYCFNYTTFSNIYDDADNLHEMIKAVIEDQRDKTGADKVVLVPMSMGATVVSAYLDKYYTDEGSRAVNYVSKVVSIVGAWDGSDGLADLLTMKTAADFDRRVAEMLGDKGARVLAHLKKDAVRELIKTAVDSFVETVILNTSTFTALIPRARYAEVSASLFTPKRMSTKKGIENVKRQADSYGEAQKNLKNRMYALRDKCGIGFYFISGYGMSFGAYGSDFSFLSLFESADKTNSDGVIQISSTAPGTAWVTAGSSFEPGYMTANAVCSDRTHNHLSPEKSVDAASCWFPETSWYFHEQEHELGTNNTALRLAGDIALGRVESVDNESYPQFNKARNIKGVVENIETAQRLCASERLPENKKTALLTAAEQAQTMLDRTVNDPELDSISIQALSRELSEVLL